MHKDRSLTNEVYLPVATAGVKRSVTLPSTKKYPRPGLVRIFRTLCCWAWTLASAYPVTVATDLWMQIEHGNPLTMSTILYALAIERTLPYIGRKPLVLCVGIPAIVFYVLVCRWAKGDVRDEQEWMQERDQQVAEIKGETFAAPRDPLLVPRHFVGRTAERNWLAEQLRIREPKVAIWGLSDCGKKGLAYIVIDDLINRSGRFLDGIVVRDCAKELDALALLKSVISAFDPQGRRPVTDNFQMLRSIANRLLADKDAIVLLHDVTEQLSLGDVVTPLADAGISVLITSTFRPPRTLVHPEHVLALGMLTADEAETLFVTTYRDVAPAGALIPDSETIEDVTAMLGYHTYAIQLVASTVAAERRELREFAKELQAQPWVVHDLREGITPNVIRLDFSGTTASLRSDSRVLFVALAAFAMHDFGRQAMQSLADGLGISLQRGLQPLLARQLLQPYDATQMPEGSDRNRYRFHPLLRMYAELEFSDWKAKADFRYRRSYLALARHYARYVTSQPRQVIACDETNICSVLEVAIGHHQDEWNALAVSICAGLEQEWFTDFSLTQAAHFLRQAVRAAVSISRTSSVSRAIRLQAAQVLYAAAAVFERIEEFQRAANAINEGIEICAAEAAYDTAKFYVAFARVRMTWHEHMPPEDDRHLFAAYAALTDALQQTRQRDNLITEGAALCQMARLYRMQHKVTPAEQVCSEAWVILQRLGNSSDRARLALHADIAYQRALIARDKGQYDDSFESFILAADIYEQLEDAVGIAQTLRHCGALSCRQGRYAKAQEMLESASAYARQADAISLCRETETILALINWVLGEGNTVGEGVYNVLRVLDIRGAAAPHVLSALEAVRSSDLDTAEQEYIKALAIVAAVRDKEAQAFILYNLSQVREKQRYFETAKYLRQLSWETLQQAGKPVNSDEGSEEMSGNISAGVLPGSA